MFNISFDFDEVVETPDEYTMGYLTIECDGEAIESRDMSGRGLMMVFFSLTSLLESIVKLSNVKKGDFRFVGEDSSFILIFERAEDRNIKIYQDNKIFCSIAFDEFVRVIWNVSELLFTEYGHRFDDDNVAKEDWMQVRCEVSSIYEQLEKR